MKLPLKTKLAFWWWKKFRLKEPINKIQKISAAAESLNSLLFILPQDRVHLAVALHLLKTLIAKNQVGSIKRLIGFEDDRNDIDDELINKTYFISKNDLNGYGLLTGEAIKRLTKGRFNAVINLDPENNPISVQITTFSSAKLRIGFGSEILKDIYNISIEYGHSYKYVEKGYKYIIEVLGL